MRLLIIGTHPFQTTGYSKVVYNICRSLGDHPDINTTVFGIQKFTTDNDKSRDNLPRNVFVWDVLSNDKEDFGFGTQSLRNFVLINRPDVILVYNDSNVVMKYIMNLLLIPNRWFKIAVYLDQLYEYQEPASVKYIAENSDYIFFFTEYWRQNLLKCLQQEKTLLEKVKINSSILKHGVEVKSSCSSPDQAKLLINFLPTDFLFLNLNRIQGRKRPDITLMAFASFLKQTRATNAYLYFPNTRDNKFDLVNIFNHCLQKMGLDISNSEYLVLTNPRDKVLSDEEINVIYSACDVGVNTCEAEGFGLCSYEHAAFGKPQIVSGVGGLVDYFNDENSIVCKPKFTLYTDNGGDIFGDANVVDYQDVANAMVEYYVNRKKREMHGKKCLDIPSKYVWKNEVQNMVKNLRYLYIKK